MVRSEYKQRLGVPFAQREGKGTGGHTYRSDARAGEEPDKELAKVGAARPVVAARKTRPRERREREAAAAARGDGGRRSSSSRISRESMGSSHRWIQSRRPRWPLVIIRALVILVYYALFFLD